MSETSIPISGNNLSISSIGSEVGAKSIEERKNSVIKSIFQVIKDFFSRINWTKSPKITFPSYCFTKKAKGPQITFSERYFPRKMRGPQITFPRKMRGPQIASPNKINVEFEKIGKKFFSQLEEKLRKKFSDLTKFLYIESMESLSISDFEKQSVETPFTIRQVPKIAKADFPRGAPKITIGSTSIDPVPNQSPGKLNTYMNKISSYCENFSQENALNESMKESLESNILMFSTQTAGNSAAYLLDIEFSSCFEGNYLEHISRTIKLNWDKENSCFNAIMIMHGEVRVLSDTPKPIGSYEIPFHFKLVKGDKDWKWESLGFKQSEVTVINR